MLDISELTEAYIKNSFTPEVQIQLINSLVLLERFGVKNYEDDLESLITLEGMVDKDNIRDLFVEKICRYLTSILEEHGVYLNEEHQISLHERLEICQFLLLVQDLEDTSILAYSLTSDDTSRNVFIGILSRYSYLDDFRAMEIIERVDNRLISAMRKFVEDSLTDFNTLDIGQLNEWKIFTAFINGSVETIGNTLKQSGYDKVTFSQLYQLEKDKIDKALLDNESSNRPQAGINAVSLLLLCKDTYQIPLMEFDKQVAGIFSHIDHVTAIRYIVSQILKDYQVFKEAYEQKELLDKGGRNE